MSNRMITSGDAERFSDYIRVQPIQQEHMFTAMIELCEKHLCSLVYLSKRTCTSFFT